MKIIIPQYRTVGCGRNEKIVSQLPLIKGNFEDVAQMPG
jgi:hypothetical protein